MKYLLALVASLVFLPLSSFCAEENSKAAAEPVAKSGKTGKATNDVPGPARWEDTIKKFESADVAMPPPKGAVLLVGGSNARRWTDISDYFPQHRVINRGFGGAQLTDVLHFVDRIVLPYAPRTILLNAGGNDLSAGKSPAQVRDAAREFLAKVHATLPDTHIYYLGLPPVRRSGESPEVLAAIREMNVQSIMDAIPLRAQKWRNLR